MSANSLTVVTNDTKAARITGALRHETKEMTAGNNGEVKAIFDDTGLVALFGRGETNQNITYQALYNDAGTLCYVYPNAAGNGIVVSTVKP